MKLTLSKSIVTTKTISEINELPNHKQTLLSKVTALAYSADGNRLSVATADRAISIYNNQGKLVDKFQTKPNAEGSKNYIVSSMHFGPNIDQPRLAIAQSDSIVFVYKWKQGSNNGESYNNVWSGKKSICNKFPEQSAVTSLIWSRKQPSQIVYGLYEGKVKIGNLRSNKSKTLYKIDVCPVVSLGMNIDGTALLSGHMDGCIYKFVFPTKSVNSTCTKLTDCASVPYALSWGRSICIACLGGSITFYNNEGDKEQSFNYTSEENGLSEMSSNEFNVSCFSPSGDSVIVGSFDSFHHFSWDSKHLVWQEKIIHQVKHMYSITSISWKPNGSSFALGTSSGMVDEYDAAFRQYSYKDAFNITHISPSQILIRDIEEVNKSPIVVESSKGEITRVNIYCEPGTSVYRYIVAKTLKSLIFCDMESPVQLISEIEWHFDSDTKEKFIFEAVNACMIYKDGEIMIVEYGQNKIIASVQTKFHSACLLSLRMNESVCTSHQALSSSGAPKTKIFAYLLDQRSIFIKDLVKMTISSIEHNVAIDFLELNTTCSHLIFRDKKQNLTMYDLSTGIKNQILSHCGYTQWIPCTDVLVAQSQQSMCVWYNIQDTDQVSSTKINGAIEGIERVDGRTEVLVDVNGSIVPYPLSDDLICFTSAIKEMDLEKCVDILEKTTETSQTLAMWLELQQTSLKTGQLHIAQRCAAALGNISLTKFLHKTLKCSDDDEVVSVQKNWRVRVQILQLRRAFSEAERLYLSYDKVDDAIFMYENMMMFQDALRLLKNKNSPDFERKQKYYFEYLMERNQEEKAAHLVDLCGDHIQAISIYLRMKLPGKAAQVILDRNLVHPQHLLENVATNLANLGVMEKAGEIYEKIGQYQNALSHFIKGFAFQSALTLARNEIPSKVTEVEELWGDYLVSINQHLQAIDHYIGSHTLQKAVDASINAKMWDRASDIVQQLHDISPHYCENLASKFLNAKKFKNAEQLFLKAGMNDAIVSMYLQNRLWDEATKSARDLLSQSDIERIFVSEAEKMIGKKKYHEAEKTFLLSNNPEMAIDMWKSADNFDNAMVLVNRHCPDFFVQTHQYFAGRRENENLLDEAELLYINAGDYLGAINMYRKKGKWDDAIRVARSSEDNEILNRVAYAYSIFLGDSAQEVLSDLKLLDNAINFALSNESFANAIKLADGWKSQEFILSMRLKAAEALEKCGKLEEAELEYIQGGKVLDAMEMYVRVKAWEDAERLAIKLNHSAVLSVFLAKAQHDNKNKNFIDAEELYIKCGKPELSLEMYRSNDLWDDALRVSMKYLPQHVDEIRMNLRESKNEGLSKFIRRGKGLEEAQLYDEAVDTYLQPKPGDFSDPHELERVWDNAIRLVKTKCSHRTEDVCNDVTANLCKLGLVSKAAEVFSQFNQIESAVKLLVKSKQFEQAKAYAQGDDSLMSFYFDAFRENLAQERNANDLLKLGEVNKAFDIMVDDGDWNRIWTILRDYDDLDPDDYTNYTVLRMNQISKDTSATSDLLSLILVEKAPIPNYQVHFHLFLTLVQNVLNFDMKKECSTDYCKVLLDLNLVLRMSFKKYHPGDNFRDEITKRFLHLIMTAHYSYQMYLCEQNDLVEIACKCSLTLLRFAILETDDTKVSLISADKIFYRAGVLCRILNHKQLAFAFLNRYIDIVEAIEEADTSELIHSDFESTNILVDNFNLPVNHYIRDEDSREEIRDWVLGICIDSNIERSLPTLSGEITGQLHEGLYDCSNEKCIVTGFPIPDNKLMKVENIEANEEDWNSFVNKFGIHPWNDIHISSAMLRL